MMARITEACIAAPSPWMKRATISTSWLGDRPHSTEAAVNSVTPKRNTRLRPIRSPSRPASSRKLPNVTRKALMTQVRLPWVKWRSRWIAGSATFTIVVSRTIMSWARQTTTRAIQRRRSGVMDEKRLFICVQTVEAKRAVGGKVEDTSRTKWRMPPHNSGGPLRFVKRISVTSTDTALHPLRPRPKRADARRNYDKVLAAAREAFAEGGAATSLEEIARRAEVGIATLYRNFPNRQALLEAVYLDEVEALCASASDHDDLPPWDALVSWLHRFVEYMVTKQALAPELLGYFDRDAAVFRDSRAALFAAGGPLLERA